MPPALLDQALKSEPGLRLLVPATDLREYTRAELQKFGYWPPWLEQDLDRDKRPDVVAVVVKPSPTGTEYGVVAVHARAPKEVAVGRAARHRADQRRRQGAGARYGRSAVLRASATLMSWFRWSGEEYEADLYAVGEKIDIGSETQEDLPLYTSPNLASKPRHARRALHDGRRAESGRHAGRAVVFRRNARSRARLDLRQSHRRRYLHRIAMSHRGDAGTLINS